MNLVFTPSYQVRYYLIALHTASGIAIGLFSQLTITTKIYIVIFLIISLISYLKKQQDQLYSALSWSAEQGWKLKTQDYWRAAKLSDYYLNHYFIVLDFQLDAGRKLRLTLFQDSTNTGSLHDIRKLIRQIY